MRAAVTPAVTPYEHIEGHWQANAPVGQWSWFGAGGNAAMLFEPFNTDQLRKFLVARQSSVLPVHVVGAMSNVIIRDGGLDGVTVRLHRLNHYEMSADEVFVEAGVRTVQLARACLRAGRGGLEFLANIPATIGGAVRMNAGAYGRAMGDCVKTIFAIDANGQWHEHGVTSNDFSYRHSSFPRDWIIVAAILRTVKASYDEIAARMADMRHQRRRSQPIKARTGGSIFKNPPQHKAWQLIDQAGCRHMTVGDAALAPHHCNFMINKGGARASDLEQLGNAIRHAVAEHSGIMLEWEIERMGQLS